MNIEDLSAYKELDVGNGSIFGDYKALFLLTKHFGWKSVLETGTNNALGAVTFCNAGVQQVVTIDPVEHVLAKEYIEKFGHTKKVNRLIGYSAKILPTVNRRFDMAFIDGDHTDDGVRADVEMSIGKVKYLILHDATQRIEVARRKNLMKGSHSFLDIAGPTKISGNLASTLIPQLETCYATEDDLYSWKNGKRHHKSFPGIALFEVK